MGTHDYDNVPAENTVTQEELEREIPGYKRRMLLDAGFCRTREEVYEMARLAVEMNKNMTNKSKQSKCGNNKHNTNMS